MSQFLFGHNVQTHNNSLANLCRGVGERVLFTDARLSLPIAPKNGIFVRKLASYREQLFRGIGRQSPVTHSQFVDYYKGPRRVLYQRAVDDLALSGVRPRDAMLKTFVKAEKLNFDLKPDPVPRVIQPRDPRYNVEVGCYLRPLEPKLYDAIDGLFRSPTIMSHYNAYRTATILKEKFDKFADPVCIGLDASRFDQHVSQQALEFEHGLYDLIYRSKKLRWLLGMQIHNRGIARASDGWFRYEKVGSRMSGDMNTSMGTKLLMCLMAKSYIDSKDFKLEFANNGDDCLLFTERKNLKHLHDLQEYFKAFGFNIVCEEPVFEFEQVEFCQTKPVCCNGRWRMVRNVKTCLTKDVTSLNLGHDVKQYRYLLRDIGNCGLATAADVPVLGAFYRMLYRFGEEGKTSRWEHAEYNYYYRSSQNAFCPHDAPDDYGRYSFWKTTGMTPDAQISIEQYFDSSIWGADNRQVIDANFYELLK